MDVRIEIHDEQAKAMLAQVDSRVRQAVHDAIWRGAEELARVAKRNAPKAFSTLTNSIRAEQVGELHFRVATGVNYARAVEEGRKPGPMPGTANGLMEWVKQKTRQTGSELDRTTFLVARAIGWRGIKPQPYMQPAFESQKDRIIAHVQAAARRAAQAVQEGQRV